MVGNMDSKVVCCIVARTNSHRLPLKVLKKVSGRRMIEHIIDRMKSVPSLDDIYIATSTHADDEVLCSVAEENGIKAYKGSELSVIDRLLDIAGLEKADYVVRVTGDNIYTDATLLNLLVSRIKEHDADYARVEGAPIGVTAEVMKVSALKHCLSCIDPELSEYLMLYMFNPERYKTIVIDVAGWVPPLTSLTVDTPDDWMRTEFIENALDDGGRTSLSDIINLSRERDIPFFRLPDDSVVKLPKGETLTLRQFYERQLELAQKCQVLVSLSQEEYLNA